MAASSEKSRMSSEKRSLKHPFHEHALTLREISKDCHVECSLCKQYSDGPTYCCEDCDFILHEACANIEPPPQIQGHPSHPPDHTLNLVPDERSYCCSDCGFSLRALTAMATSLPLQDLEEDTIRHFCHEEHPLSSFRVETALEVQCGLCNQQICAGQVYGCRSCMFLLHGECARLTLEIQHPLHHRHPLTFLATCNQKCKVCLNRNKSGPAYCCEACGFALHVKCTVLTMDARSHREEEDGSSSSSIMHFCHEHPLTPLHVGEMVQSRIRCKVCRLYISGDEAFACGSCSFFLHKSCAEKLPKVIQHSLHPQHTGLILKPKDSFGCNSCMYRDSGITFSCKDCEFNLEPVCAFQVLSAIEDGAAPNLSIFAHEHALTLALAYADRPFRKSFYPRARATSTSTRNCAACTEIIDGLAYCCTTCEHLWLHRTCAELPDELEHALHSQHPLVLLESPGLDFSCFGCHETHAGLAFYCAECQFYMGVRCPSMNQTMKHPRHEHCLYYYEKSTTEPLHQCKCCIKRCRYDFYCCMRCNFSLHRDCLHLPPTVDHKSHRHPLKLLDKFVYGDPQDQYCDYCETIRNPDHGIYHCDECEFSAHIECIIFDYQGEANGLETWGNDRSNQLYIEIASRKEKSEILKRDLEAMEANLKASVEALEEVENEDHQDEDEDDDDNDDDDDEEEDDDDDDEEDDDGDDDDEEDGDDDDDEEDDDGDDDEEGDEDEDDDDDEDEDDDDEDKEQEDGKQQNGLKHPCHKHPLSLRIISENCQLVDCNLCKLEICGPAYCCESCDYFLHKPCALIELPPQIRHPSHPRHPLTLSKKAYKCNKCSEFRMHALTAIATLPPQDEEELDEYSDKDEPSTEEDKEQQEKGIIRHFAHEEHPLASFHVEIQLSTKCIGCRRPISGQVYGCQACLFLLHASCARSPQVIDHHPFGSGFTLAQLDADPSDVNSTHPDSDHDDVRDKCGACAKYIQLGFVYSRSDDLGRLIRLHMACALATRFPQGEAFTNSTNLKLHPSHPCPLVLLHIEDETYAPIRCRACELKISGEALGCPGCCFFLHKSCAEKLPEEIDHYLHMDHPKLVLEARGESMSTYLEYKCRCATCQIVSYRLYSNPCMAFQCDSCEFYLNPNCVLQTSAAVEEGAAPSIVHFSHDHPLLLHLMRNNKFYDCKACEDYIEGLTYRCVTCDSTQLHKSCAELPHELAHPFHSQHRLVLLSKASAGYFHCGACHYKSEGFAYYCAECEFYLDVGCASRDLTLKHPRHEHKLAYFKRSMTERGRRCNACGKRCQKDLYQCVPCNFSLHHDCLPLPPEITHEGHRLHPLFLRDRFVEGDPNYQYCDHCEELRHPEHGVYHCEECWFSAHIDCMISKNKVEAEEIETEAGAKLMTTSNESEGDQADSRGAHLKAVVDGSKKNIDKIRGSIAALMKELQELELERESL